MFVRAALITLILLSGLGFPCGAGAQPTERHLSSDEACAVLKKRLAAHDGLARDRIDVTWYCDVTTVSVRDWWVIGLRSFRPCEGVCSNLRGWFAVHRITGEVREFDMGEDRVGDGIPAP